MPRSNFNKNLLATGSNLIGLWDLGNAESTYSPLELEIPEMGMELAPTSLVWGVNREVQDILVPGMSEKDTEIASVSGAVGEASVVPQTLIPNSQDIFDVKCHPVKP